VAEEEAREVINGEQRITAGVKTTIRLDDHREQRRRGRMMLVDLVLICWTTSGERGIGRSSWKCEQAKRGVKSSKSSRFLLCGSNPFGSTIAGIKSEQRTSRL
jgi:hypothetical protein